MYTKLTTFLGGVDELPYGQLLEASAAWKVARVSYFLWRSGQACSNRVSTRLLAGICSSGTQAATPGITQILNGSSLALNSYLYGEADAS
jgi:hypothetical protein